MLFDKKGNNPALAVGYLFKGLKLLARSRITHVYNYPGFN